MDSGGVAGIFNIEKAILQQTLSGIGIGQLLNEKQGRTKQET